MPIQNYCVVETSHRNFCSMLRTIGKIDCVGDASENKHLGAQCRCFKTEHLHLKGLNRNTVHHQPAKYTISANKAELSYIAITAWWYRFASYLLRSRLPKQVKQGSFRKNVLRDRAPHNKKRNTNYIYLVVQYLAEAERRSTSTNIRTKMTLLLLFPTVCSSRTASI